MPKNSAEPEAIRAKYQQLIERIDALFARIPGGLSVATEAKHGRRARRWRTAMYSFIGLLVLCAIAWLAGPSLALPEWIVTYARSAAALAATIVFALALLMLRRAANLNRGAADRARPGGAASTQIREGARRAPEPCAYRRDPRTSRQVGPAATPSGRSRQFPSRPLV